VKTSQIPSHVAIVTGGGRGLGRAMVLGLAQAGIHVVATAARERTEIEAVAEEVRQSCGESRILPLVADVTQEDDCAEVVDAAVKRFGRLDILVNNAGRGMKYVSDEFLTEPTRFWEVAPETWRLVIDTNVNGPFMMARHAVPVMLKAGWGRIVNVSVSQGTMRRRGFSPYGPSKAALESETIIWAQDLEGTGVTVNALLLECYAPSLVAWRVLARVADAFMTIDDEDAVMVMNLLARPSGGDPAIVAGESGGVGLAGMLRVAGDVNQRAALRLDAHSRVFVVNTEGATDPGCYEELVGLTPNVVLSNMPANCKASNR
jgi:NAD(P)-dependent dehydrogenase (short-subunit alcohol dehydrogenase family)